MLGEILEIGCSRETILSFRILGLGLLAFLTAGSARGVKKRLRERTKRIKLLSEQTGNAGVKKEEIDQR